MSIEEKINRLLDEYKVENYEQCDVIYMNDKDFSRFLKEISGRLKPRVVDRPTVNLPNDLFFYRNVEILVNNSLPNGVFLPFSNYVLSKITTPILKGIEWN